MCTSVVTVVEYHIEMGKSRYHQLTTDGRTDGQTDVEVEIVI